MDIAYLIKHPENLDRDTLYDLRSLLALYPYYQSARLLLLQCLFLLHDPSFDEELRRAALYITDRKVLFNLVEAMHYQLRWQPSEEKAEQKGGKTVKPSADRTISLIDNFLEQIPEDKKEEETKKPKRKPTPADAAVDYVSYLLSTEEFDDAGQQKETPQLKGHDLIDNFINNEGGKIKLKEEPEYAPVLDVPNEESPETGDEGYFTETLAKIYIKQGRYEKALEIIRRINLNNPKKNAYFADQSRFLEKLILNNKKQ